MRSADARILSPSLTKQSHFSVRTFRSVAVSVARL
jgi:hypothetical protein